MRVKLFRVLKFVTKNCSCTSAEGFFNGSFANLNCKLEGGRVFLIDFADGNRASHKIDSPFFLSGLRVIDAILC